MLDRNKALDSLLGIREPMKHTIAFLVCILAGIGIGWYFGHARAITEYQREALKHLPAIEAQMADLNKQRTEDFKAAKPYEASSASIALAALENLDTNDVEGARSRLAAIVAVYYRGHSGDGDTNLLTSIVSFAGRDTVLSNAIYSR
jgi:predicted negative regulator of RcsB-dependent stress response